ncbi:MAG: hypothetical protein JXP39_05510 [Spirochaetales bacterium]|nr:hypothetical protein [Spirochaetales bacterium]
MSVKRAARFLNRIIEATIILFGIIVILALVQHGTGIFTPILREFSNRMAQAERLLDKRTMLGISSGMIVFTLASLLFPLFLRRVNKAQYRVNTLRGIISSVVFFFTQMLYSWAALKSRLHMFASMALAIIATLVIIEFLSHLISNEEEVSFRTDLLSAASSGLAAGIVIRLIQIAAAQL